jgi:hypothetical protein
VCLLCNLCRSSNLRERLKSIQPLRQLWMDPAGAASGLCKHGKVPHSRDNGCTMAVLYLKNGIVTAIFPGGPGTVRSTSTYDRLDSGKSSSLGWAEEALTTDGSQRGETHCTFTMGKAVKAVNDTIKACWHQR